MAGMISVHFEDPANVPAPESHPEFTRLEEFVPQGRWRSELIVLFPMTPAAQRCVVVGREHRSAACTATADRTGRALPLWTGSSHLFPARLEADLISDQQRNRAITTRAQAHQRCIAGLESAPQDSSALWRCDGFPVPLDSGRLEPCLGWL